MIYIAVKKEKELTYNYSTLHTYSKQGGGGTEQNIDTPKKTDGCDFVSVCAVPIA